MSSKRPAQKPRTERLEGGTNLVPRPYRQVSVQPYRGPMTRPAILRHLVGREAYRHTRYVILEGDGCCAVAEVGRAALQPDLFSPISNAVLIAGPERCTLCEDAAMDTANASALAGRARSLGLGPEDTLVVRGRDGHVNFIHRPDPRRIEVVDVVPPRPAKLAWMAEQVLAYADLPAIELSHHTIDLRQLASQVPEQLTCLIPCRSSALGLERPTCFLDERPKRRDWMLVGCQRSRDIHRHFYGDEPPCLETCPRLGTPRGAGAQLLKCCLLEDSVELSAGRAVIPWGATRGHVEQALRALCEQHG